MMNSNNLSWLLVVGSDAASIQRKLVVYADRFRKDFPQKYRVDIHELKKEQYGITFDPPLPPLSFLSLISTLCDPDSLSGLIANMGWLVSPGTGTRYFLRIDPDGMGDTLLGISDRGEYVSVYIPDGTLSRSMTAIQVVKEPMFPTVEMKKVASFEIILDDDPNYGNRQFVPDDSLCTLDMTKIYPYVVPSDYLEGLETGPPGFILPLGNESYVMLVHDHGYTCANVLPQELSAAGVNAKDLHHRALENLLLLAKGSAFTKSIHKSPHGTPFLAWSGHWLAASCIRVPGLFKFASKHLQTDKLCVSISQRESMILFPFGTLEQRQQMRALIHENEKDARKLITWQLFTLTATELQPLIE